MTRTLYKTLFLLVLSLALSACRADDTRAVTMVGYNYTDRPIGTFSVNGAGGSNVFAKEESGGGKMSCCVDVTVGKMVRIDWVYHRKEKQELAGFKIEDHSTVAVVPSPQTPESDYLEVHFFPDNHVELRLVKFPGRARWDEIPNHGALND